MCYSTANDTDFFADFMNFFRLARFDPGVPEVNLFLIVSEVRPFSAYDRTMVQKLMELAAKKPENPLPDYSF